MHVHGSHSNLGYLSSNVVRSIFVYYAYNGLMYISIFSALDRTTPEHAEHWGREHKKVLVQTDLEENSIDQTCN